ncbi:hypothetical protein AHF37_02245 [Paragonimus kellicotti]|nr:hypothetical protein AHF37_02245 [Paragonimus kellicotti]
MRRLSLICRQDLVNWSDRQHIASPIFSVLIPNYVSTDPGDPGFGNCPVDTECYVDKRKSAEEGKFSTRSTAGSFIYYTGENGVNTGKNFRRKC